MSFLQIQPDLMVADEFFEFIAPMEELSFRTFDDCETSSVKPLKIKGYFDEVTERLSHQNRLGAGCFWIVNPSNGTGQSDADIVGVRALFLDLDGSSLDPVIRTEAMPHVVLETSPGKYHTYWLIDSGFSVSLFSQYQKAIAKRFNGDQTICNPSRVMRIPGFYHVKNRENPFMSRIVSKREMMPYSPEDLVAALDLKLEQVEVKTRLVTGGVGAIPQGTRDNTLYSNGCCARNAGMNYEGILNLLQQQNRDLCLPPLNAKSVERIARQAAKLSSYAEDKLVVVEPKEKKISEVEFLTFAEVEEQQVEDVNWIVPELLPQGLTIIGGAPKMGKSFLVQQLSYSVALGGLAMSKFPVVQGSTLHLALEDPLARFKRRMEEQKKHEGPAPRCGYFTNHWNTIPKGIDDIRRWCDDHVDAKLVVVDTLAKLIGEENNSKGQTLYNKDYRTMGHFHKIALDYGIGVLVVQHTNQGEHKDPMNSISGSSGITGAADLVWIFNRRLDRNAMTANLRAMGKDLSDATYHLTWDSKYSQWICVEYENMEQTGNIAATIRKYFDKNNNEPASVSDIAVATNVSRQSLTKTLKGLVRDELMLMSNDFRNVDYYRPNVDLI
jgi:hypothetical protein